MTDRHYDPVEQEKTSCLPATVDQAICRASIGLRWAARRARRQIAMPRLGLFSPPQENQSVLPWAVGGAEVRGDVDGDGDHHDVFEPIVIFIAEGGE